MAKKLILSVALIILAVFLGIFLSYEYTRANLSSVLPEADVSREQQSVPESARTEEPAPPTEAQDTDNAEAAENEETQKSGYYLRDYKGKIAIFPAGSETPEMVFDVYTRILPDSDQARLQDGVYVADYEELTRLVEDYIS